LAILRQKSLRGETYVELTPGRPDAEPPCFEAPPLLCGGEKFLRVTRGKAPSVPASQGCEEREPATP
jgi:hypothetical protein